MLKRTLRYFLAWSSRPPLLSLYRMMYRLAVRLATIALGNRRGIHAVYLTRGCSKNDITPGISDIDLIVIVDGDPRQRRSTERVFRILQAVTAGLIPAHPSFLMTREEMHYLWRTTPFWRSRLQEGKSTWSLLAGRECLASLPVITELERTASCSAEMNYWWVQFCDFILQRRKYRDDVVVRGSICYKAVAEVLSAHHAFRTGEFCYSRNDALRRADSPLSRKLLESAKARFLRHDKALEEEAYRFLIAALWRLWREFPDRPFLEVHPDMLQEVGAPGDRTLEEPFQEICRHLSREWGGVFCGAHLIKSAFWEIEDWLIVVDADPDLPPSLDDLAQLIEVRNRVCGDNVGVHLFLRLQHIAFPITPAAPRDFHRGVLTSATAPDVFIQLGEKKVYWTSHTSWYLTDWQRNRQWRDASPLKRLQLESIVQSAAQGRVYYPLSARDISESGQRLASQPSR